MTTWLVQSTGIAYRNTLPLVEALSKNNIPFEDVSVIPFSDEIPRYTTTDKNLIPYGSTRLMQLFPAAAGMFFNENFATDVWNEKRDDMLNQDARVLSLDESYAFIKQFPESEFFIRPNDDGKAFAGATITGKDFIEWIEKVTNGNFLKGKIVISSIQRILMEWRYFVVDSKIVDGSVYKFQNKLQLMREVDKDVLDEAQTFADKWLPHSCCVMDLALTSNGLKVVEFNCLNASGFYKNDVEKIVREVTKYVHERT